MRGFSDSGSCGFLHGTLRLTELQGEYLLPDVISDLLVIMIIQISYSAVQPLNPLLTQLWKLQQAVVYPGLYSYLGMVLTLAMLVSLCHGNKTCCRSSVSRYRSFCAAIHSKFSRSSSIFSEYQLSNLSLTSVPLAWRRLSVPSITITLKLLVKSFHSMYSASPSFYLKFNCGFECYFDLHAPTVIVFALSSTRILTA